ncbi:MAG: hypothetical protein R2865_15955 [Deinococcales bacterium]
MMAIIALSYINLISYLISSPRIFMGAYGLSKEQFALVFALVSLSGFVPSLAMLIFCAFMNLRQSCGGCSYLM